jgi:alpha 1,2-mannosyltransferase
MVNAAIFILTQCNESRKIYLKSCLYFLFRYFNEAYKYPVIIFHEGDYDSKSQEEIFKSVRQSCRHLVSFRQLDPDDFKVPPHIDAEKAQRCIDLKCTPYWRNLAYRNMCRWWLVHMPRYAAAYDYIMRIDDDLFIEEQIKTDIIAEAAAGKKVYISNMIHVDCPLCCYGFKELLCALMPKQTQKIEGLFQKQEAPSRAHQLNGLRSLISIAPIQEGPIGEKITLWSPVMNYNNFHITASAFWKRQDVQELINSIDRSGLIYYYRLGDSPVQSAVTMLLAKPEELGRNKFRYSKRLQRECHHGDDGVLHSYMPGTYSKTSDVTEEM